MFPWMSDVSSPNKNLEKVERCYKLLLDAGSDISSGTLWNSAFYTALYGGTLVRRLIAIQLCNAADHSQANLKALIDLGEPFISLESITESISDSHSENNVPLLLLAYLHSKNYYTNVQIPDKVGLLLTRGANIKARNPQGKTCLHLVLLEHLHDGDHCWCNDGYKLWRHQCRTRDMVILMITAGADVCAVDGKGKSVSDVAIRSGQQTLWTEALEYCGIDIKDVLARPNLDPAHSTALSPEYSQPPRSVTSEMSLEKYLQRRKAFCVPEERGVRRRYIYLDSSEDDDSGDEGSKSGLSPSEDHESEDEDWTEDTNKNPEFDEQVSDDADDGTPSQYGKDNAKGKKKLD